MFFFSMIFFSRKISLKITFKYNLSEMYLLHERNQHPTFHYAAQDSPYFPGFTEILKKEDSI